jgi:hypothetical protein
MDYSFLLASVAADEKLAGRRFMAWNSQPYQRILAIRISESSPFIGNSSS